MNVFPNSHYPETEPGIAKREYFAALAMQALVTGITEIDDEGCIILNRPKSVAEIAAVYADALIAELGKGGA